MSDTLFVLGAGARGRGRARRAGPPSPVLAALPAPPASPVPTASVASVAPVAGVAHVGTASGTPDPIAPSHVWAPASVSVRTRPARRRRWRTVVPVALLASAAVAFGAYGSLALASSPTDISPAGAAPIDATATAAGAVGAAAGNAVPGTQSAYYQPTPATPAELQTPGQYIYTGRDAPDPFMLVTGGRYYLYTSQGNTALRNVPVVTGTIVGHFGAATDALPHLPTWAVPGFTWAPDVHRFGNRYVLYFTSDIVGTHPADECIGDATGTSPLGPFTPVQAPFICQLTQHGSIDPRTFTDLDGTTYMLWKSDDNATVTGTSLTNIYAQPLSANGLQLLGKPTRIFGPDEHWQGRIVEAPDMIVADGTYWLFYSGGWFNQSAYSIGVARCAGPLGPCADTTAAPWFVSNSQGQGPGEESVFRDRWGVWLLYTPWRSEVPQPTPPRPVAMARIGFGPLGPYVAAPDAPLGVGGP